MTTHHLETLTLEHLPPHHAIHIGLYKNVKNSTFLQEQLVSGNEGFEYAFVGGDVVLSRVHILAAVYRAIHDFQTGRMKSRNVHSEVVFSLSPNNNISESFRRFGISPSTTNLLVVKISLPPKEVSREIVIKHLDEVVEGESVPFSDEELVGMTDEKRVRKIYKLNALAGGGGKMSDVVTGMDERREMEVLVLGGMALRGFGS